MNLAPEPNLSHGPTAVTRSPQQDEDLGLLVLLSGTKTILQRNSHANGYLERLRRLQSAEPYSLDDTAPAEYRDLPATVHAVCDDAHQTLSDRSEHNLWQPFEICRLVGNADDAMVVRAYVFPSRASLAQTRVLVTLHPLSPE
ncbi:MAG: hypothetical protein U0172_11665 [Nitrospiraceae bacterium]